MEDLVPRRPYVLVLADPATLDRGLERYLTRVGEVRVVRFAATARTMLAEPVECLGYIGDADHEPLDAYELCRVVRKRWRVAPRAILIEKPDRNASVLAARHGAYIVPKPVDLISFYQFVETPPRQRESSGTFAKQGKRADELIARASLSHREAEVLRAFLQGRGPDDVATRLGIARKTLNNHVVAILRKTGDDTMQKLVVSLLVDRAQVG